MAFSVNFLLCSAMLPCWKGVAFPSFSIHIYVKDYKTVLFCMQLLYQITADHFTEFLNLLWCFVNSLHLTIILLPVHLVNLAILFHFCLAASTTEGYFDGNAYAEYLLHKTPIKSSSNTIQLSFLTIQPNGMILHGDSTGDEFGDYFTLELIGGKLRYGTVSWLSHLLKG